MPRACGSEVCAADWGCFAVIRYQTGGERCGRASLMCLSLSVAPQPDLTGSKCVFIIAVFAAGGIAQLGERLHGMQEVSGSIPLTSTKKQNLLQLSSVVDCS